MTRRPYFPFFAGDWLSNPRVRSVGPAARGLWLDLMCVMHDCVPYGHLCTDGRPMDDDEAANSVGLTVPVYLKLLAKLEYAKIAKRREDGAIYSSRMVSDEELRHQRAMAGATGAATVKQHTKQLAGYGSGSDSHNQQGIPKGEPDPFEVAWVAYPKRPGNPKERARKAWVARMREGVDPKAIIDGVHRYAGYVRKERTEPRYIKMASTFFGPDRHWEADYTFTPQRPAQSAPVVTYPKFKQEGIREFDREQAREQAARVLQIQGGIGEMPKSA